MFNRSEAYLGVMIDDLVTRGVTEPYRMFTSRAEYRLKLRADNADQRLTERGIAIGCVGGSRAASHGRKMQQLDEAMAYAKAVSVTPNEAEKHDLSLNRDGQRRTAFELLSYPSIDLAAVTRIWPEFAKFPAKIAEQVEINAKYAVYLERQNADVAAYQRDEAMTLPEDIDYSNVAGLSNEARQKLGATRPRTVGQAGRIDGMTPAALMLLAAHVRRGRPKQENRR
jgi:tRNA uridine 5-carboxymethylaminomethyl modification enzyme